MLEPADQIWTRKTLQLPVSKLKLTKKQIEAGLEETYHWSVLGLLDTLSHKPTTLEDVGLTQTTVETVNQTILNLWCRNPTSAAMMGLRNDTDNQNGGSKDPPVTDGPFSDERHNEIWRVLASQMIEGYIQLADVDMLEPDLANHTQVMKNP